MNTFQKVLIGGGIAVALIFSVYALNRAGQTIVQQVAPSLGAVPTLDGVDNPYVSIGGVRTWNGRQNMSATSTIPCSFRNPFQATSTIVAFSAQITSGITGTNQFSLSTTSSTTGYGSSTPSLIRDHSVTTNAQDSVFWQPYATTTVGNVTLLPGMFADGSMTAILGPNEWVTWRYATSTSNAALAVYPTGMCTVLIRKI